MNEFQKAYTRLNDTQKTAVDTLYGPVSVIAGPGTGKTQLLTLRIANLLQQEGVFAENILALTFTEAGVIAMRDRLRSFIGNDAYKVHISTFHGFCNDIIQSYPERFQFAEDLIMLDDLTKHKLIGKIFLDGTWDHLFNRYDPEMYLGDTIANVSQLKREGVSPELYEERIHAALKDLETREDLRYTRKFRDKQPGDKKQAFFTEEAKLHKQLEWVTVYRQYEEKLREGGLYDYDDMISMVVNELTNDHDFQLLLQEKYQFLLIDEYQDTNSLQNTIAMKLVEGLDQPNILIVGDDEQSIYRFQGALMENVLEFHHHFERYGLTTVVLTENYRSNQGILDASRTLVSHNEESLEKDLNLDKSLRASHPDFAGAPSAKIHNFIASDDRIETDYLVHEIQRLHDAGMSYADMGVIYKKHAHAEDIIDVFQRNNIPFYKPAGEQVLYHPEAQKLIQTLKIIGNTDDNELLWEVLLYDFWQLDVSHLLKVQNENRGQGMNNWKRNLFKALYESDDWNIKIVLGKLEGLHTQAANLTAVGFFEAFLSGSKMAERETMDDASPEELAFIGTGYREFILGQPDKIERLSILDTLFSELKRFNADRPDATIYDFIDYLDDCQKYGIFIGTKPLKFSPDAVHLMTAHGSKGLEYEAIFLYKTYTKNWESSRSPGKLPITARVIGDETGAITETETKQQKVEEQRRLFFVSMTRAKEHLYLLSTKNPDQKQEPSAFIYEIDEQHIDEVTYAPDQKGILGNTTSHIPPLNWSEITESEIRDRIKSYVLAPTHLNTWLHSPRLFYERHLIQQPMGKSRTLSFGTAIHAVLEAATRYACDHKAIMPRDLAYASLEKALKREILTTHERADEMEKGKKVIDGYFESKGHHLSEFALSEFRVNKSRPVIIADMPCSGSLDRIEYLPNRDVRVVDYKTGSIKRPGTPQWDDYERQLYFYKLLWDGLGRSEPLVEGCIDFVMHPRDGNVQRKIVEFDVEKLRQLEEHVRLFRESLLADTLEFPEEGLLPLEKK